MSDEEIILRSLARIEAKQGQIESNIENLQNTVAEIAGGLAVVLSRSDENKSEIGIIRTELEANKKKRINYKSNYGILSNISEVDWQKTRLALSQWRARHPLRRM